MITVCWKKYCMIPVYKEGNILFYILNKIVLTRYTPKKVHRKWLLKALTTITWHCIFASYHAIFFQLCKFQLPLSYINKKLIYRLNSNKAEPKGLRRLFRAISKKTTHSYNATQKGWSGPKVLIRCELVFCNWATSNGQQTEAQCSAKQALLCICFCKIRLFYFCFCGRWHFWFCGGTFSKDFQVVLWNLKSLIRILYHFIKVSFFHLVISIY